MFWDINGEWWKCIRSRRDTKLVWYSPLCFCCCQPFISSCPLPLPPAAFSMKYGLVMLLDWPWTLGSSSLPVSASRVAGIRIMLLSVFNFLYSFVAVVFCLRHVLSTNLWLSWNWLCRWCWPQLTEIHLPLLGLKACVIMPGSFLYSFPYWL